MKGESIFLVVAAAVASIGFGGDLTAKIAAKFPVTGTDEWYGCRRTVFRFDGHEAWVVEPPAGVKVAEGSPWTWTMQWATAYVPRTSVPRLVKEKGWRHVTILTFDEKMDERGLDISRRFHDFLVDELGFAKKANLIGMSWGGFFSTRYAATFPDRVERIYLDCPYMTFDGRDGIAGKIGSWEKTMPKDGWANDPRMPINMCGRIAEARIPVLLLYGGQDQTLPVKYNAEAFVRRFREAGGDLHYTLRPYYGHHPHGVEESENAIVNFFVDDEENAARRNFDLALARIRAAKVENGEVTSAFRYNSGEDYPACLKSGPDVGVVRFVLRPTRDSEINCRLLLPLSHRWNGRFWGVGNQGFGDAFADWHVRHWMLPRAHEGGAVCMADMGTAKNRYGREVVRDFGWRAHHAMTVAAKKLIAEFYGKPIAHSYFIGLSSGGGQGIHEALRFPEDYEGIVSYVPAHYRTAHAREFWNFYRQSHDATGKLLITPGQCKAVVDAAISYFAPQEPPYAAGRFITSPTYSREAAEGILDLAAQACPELAGADLRRRWISIWEGPEIGGRHPAGYTFGADFTERLKRGSFMHKVLSGASGKPVHEMSEQELEDFIAAIGPDVDATGTDLSAFAARGGKLILVSGLSDQFVSARTAWNWCERLATDNGGADALKPFFRAYFLPGRNHGGRVPGREGVDDVPAAQTLVDWCERGRAPDALIGALKDGTKVPIAPWPLKTVGTPGRWATAPMGHSTCECK